MTGGDSVRKYFDGHLCNGLIEDHYPDGTILHKGYYTDGKITIYSNYYPDGQQERTFKMVSDRKNEMIKYYQNKKTKSDVQYYLGNTTLWQDYYDNGQLSYLEEYDKKHERLMRRCSYFRDGKPESIFMPDESNKVSRGMIVYTLKEYFPSGQLHEESQMLYSKDSYDFMKDGYDKVYDEKGTLVGQYDYEGGRLSNSIEK
jgi:MORN repeat variant